VQMKILHRDLKPSNILFHNKKIKIADFGFCKPLAGAFDSAETMVGSPIYMAPEILKGQPYNLKADLYSLGVVLYEMLYGVCPYEDSTIPGLLAQIQKGRMVFHNYNKISKSTENLLKRMIEPMQSKRIEWDELFEYFLMDTEISKPITSGADNSQNTSYFKLTDQSSSSTTPVIEPLTFDNQKQRDTSAVYNNNAMSMSKKKIDTTLLYQNYIEQMLTMRLKFTYLWRAYKESSENLISLKSHRINLHLLRKLVAQGRKIVQRLCNENSDIPKEEFELIRANFDCARLMSIHKKEVTEAEALLENYETFFKTLPKEDQDPNNIGKNIDKPPMPEKDNKELRDYVDQILSHVQRDVSPDEYTNKKNLILANFLVDSIGLDEAIENFFNKSKTINEQSYLKNIYDWNNSSIEEFVKYKLTYFAA